jgi:branched-chain amino acid transport system ATP-binding protein
MSLLRKASQTICGQIGVTEMAMLKVEKINKRFGGLIAVQDFNLQLEEKEIIGLIGPNGAGKTTVFNMIAGFYRPDSGRIAFKGLDLTGMRPYKICSLGIARTFQVTKPFGDITVLENIMVGSFAKIRNTRDCRNNALEVLEFVGFSSKKDLLGNELTSADHKRLELARALATNPKLLLLDEPMAGLNQTEKTQLINLLREIQKKGIALLVVEHDMKAIMSLCQRIFMLDQGKKLLEGLPEEITRDPRAISAYLGDEYGHS